MSLSRIVLVNSSVNTGAAAPHVVTTTAASPAGNTILVYVVAGNVGNTGGSCADSVGNPYTQKVNPANMSSSYASMWECANALALPLGGTISITFPSNFASSGIVGAESINCLASPNDVSATSTGTGTSASSGSTAAAAGVEEYLVSVFFAVDSTTPSELLSSETQGWTAGFALAANVGLAANAFQSLNTFYSDEAPASGTYSDGGTYAASVNWSASIFAFKLALSDPFPVGFERRPPATYLRM